MDPFIPRQTGVWADDKINKYEVGGSVSMFVYGWVAGWKVLVLLYTVYLNLTVFTYQ